ncbi:MAG: hypothetical protein A2W26_10235 [Acidobacteria bacterium RBG_16_64_8]|nr:MAG: hypothetical protein A2W26_10235 [Acidobacteria bacterium RBG_16_64_8]
MHHNWRVANYVNNPTLGDGQYGYASRFGYSPWQQIGAWDTLAGCPAVDVVAVPPKVTMGPTAAKRETTLVRIRLSDNGLYSYPMALQPLGAEYWVVRSDAGLPTGYKLVVRVSPHGIFHEGCQSPPGRDGRLMASVIGYTSQLDSLYKHPEWARLASEPPKFTDVDSLASDLEFVVPSFGDSNEASLVVLSLGDGPSSGFVRLNGITSNDWIRALPYRLSLSLAKPPYPPPFSGPEQNPVVRVQSVGKVDDNPTWSPDGLWLAFESTRNSTYRQLHRSFIGGTNPLPPLAARPYNQVQPDWSPRGDWIVFAQDSLQGARQHIWLFSTTGGQTIQLTTGNYLDARPAFQPNGQGIAFGRTRPNVNQGELWRMQLDGTGLVQLASVGPDPIQSVRWTPQGDSLYFTHHDSLFALAASGGPVQSRRALLGGIQSAAIDLPRGEGPLAVEQPGSLQPGPGPGCPPVSFRRLALADTKQNPTDVQGRFYRTGVEYFHPRWAFDGLRLAYSTDLNEAQRDLYVGLTSFDHAPTFNPGVTDTILSPGVAYQLDLTAADADGDPLTYHGAHLPSGSFLAGSTFVWPDPQSGLHFVAFRALDPAGGAAHKVVKFTVDSGGGDPGCPVVDSRTASGWAVENTVLGRSADGSLVRDAYRLKAEPEAAVGVYRLRIRENEREATTLDQAALVALDHAPEVRAFRLGSRFVLGTSQPAARVSKATGEDLTATLAGGGGFVGNAGDTVDVEFSPSAPSGTLGQEGRSSVADGDPGGMVTPLVWKFAPTRLKTSSEADYAALTSSGILVQIPDGTGSWRRLKHIYPRERPDEFGVDSIGTGPVRLVFLSRHRLGMPARVVPAAGTVSPQILSLQSARHARLGNVLSAVATTGGSTTPLIAGDTLNLEFSAPSVPSGKVRDLFLLTTGVYTTLSPSEGPAESVAQPTWQFALGPARPNPSSGDVNFGFTMAQEGPVSIRIYNVAGRLVRTLVNETAGAGPHDVLWNAADDHGRRVAPGVYFYRMAAGSWSSQRKVVFLER